MPVSDSSPQLPPCAALLQATLPFPRKTTIVDVGANPIHETPYDALLAARGCHVIGFEPQEAAFAQLQRSKGPDETYHPHAVGDGQSHTLHLYEIDGFTSFFTPHRPAVRLMGHSRWARIRESVTLDTVALDAIPDLAPFDLLKIDIQGGEPLVFDNASRVLQEAVAVIVELRFMQLYDGEPMMGGVDECLRRHGFQIHKFLFNKRKALPHSQFSRLSRRKTPDQLIDGDAVYLRHPGKIEAYSDAQLMHLALLAASVFESHSVALYALDELVRRKLIPADMPARYVDALPEKMRTEPEPAAAPETAPQAAPQPEPPQPEPAAAAPAAQTTPAAKPAPKKPSPAKKTTARKG